MCLDDRRGVLSRAALLRRLWQARATPQIPPPARLVPGHACDLVVVEPGLEDRTWAAVLLAALAARFGNDEARCFDDGDRFVENFSISAGCFGFAGGRVVASRKADRPHALNFVRRHLA